MAISSNHPLGIFPYDELYCTAEGSAGKGETCASIGACRAGLICHVPGRSKRYACAPPCGMGLPACTAGTICAETGDGSGSGGYPTAVQACAPP